ncbi:hypothetical protein MMC17_000029 [Xylographa soralifera]|nr:hypothetical protein [Xylographa soralifera]
MNTVTDSHVTPMSPFSPGIRYRPKRQAYDRNSPALRHLQNSLMQPFQRLLEGPVEIAASRTPPAESQPRFIQSTPKVSSSRNELLAAGASSAKVIEGYQPTAMSVDDVFASEIAAQRKTRADRQKVVEAEKWERLREQRAAKMEALTKQEAERTKRIAEREAELEVQRLAKSNAEMEVQQPMDDEKAKTEKQIIVKQVSKETNQHRREKYNLAVQRGKTNKRLRAKQEAERQRNMRAQEKSLEQIYAEHNIDVIKIGTRSGGAMYAPWDSTLGDILDEQKREELDRKGIYFWLEAGTAVSVPPERESLETIEDVNMSG